MTDIPLKDLQHHASYYGNVAIGYRADAVHRAGFVPVLYFPESLLPVVEVLISAPLDSGLVRMANEFDQFEIGSGSSTDRAYQNLMRQAQLRAEEKGSVAKRVYQVGQAEVLHHELRQHQPLAPLEGAP